MSCFGGSKALSSCLAVDSRISCSAVIWILAGALFLTWAKKTRILHILGTADQNRRYHSKKGTKGKESTTECYVLVDFTSPMRALTADILQPCHTCGRLNTNKKEHWPKMQQCDKSPRALSHPLGELFLASAALSVVGWQISDLLFEGMSGSRVSGSQLQGAWEILLTHHQIQNDDIGNSMEITWFVITRGTYAQ